MLSATTRPTLSPATEPHQSGSSSASHRLQPRTRATGRRLHLGALVLPLVAATAVAGCGSSNGLIGTATGSKTKAKNACTVLDLALAKETIGSGAKLTMKKQPNPHETHCQYQNTAKGSNVDVEVGDWNVIKGFGKEDGDKSLAGLGDQAWVGDFGLTVKKGDEGITIDVIPQSGTFTGSAATSQDKRAAAAEEKLAPKLLARL